MKNRKIISESATHLMEGVTGFKQLPCIEEKNKVCPYCGCRHAILPMQEVIAVGFGDALLTKNGEFIYSAMEVQSCDDYMSVAQAEELAAADPNHEWRIHLISPFSELHYQRQGECHWVLYKKGEGCV